MQSGKGKKKKKANPSSITVIYLPLLLYSVSLEPYTTVDLTENQTDTTFQPLTKHSISFLNTSFSSTCQNPSASVHKSLLASEQFPDWQHTLTTWVCELRNTVTICDLPPLQMTSPQSLTSLFARMGQMLLQLFFCWNQISMFWVIW